VYVAAAGIILQMERDGNPELKRITLTSISMPERAVIRCRCGDLYLSIIADEL
jgi:hypothetical protein